MILAGENPSPRYKTSQIPRDFQIPGTQRQKSLGIFTTFLGAQSASVKHSVCENKLVWEHTGVDTHCVRKHTLCGNTHVRVLCCRLETAEMLQMWRLRRHCIFFCGACGAKITLMCAENPKIKHVCVHTKLLLVVGDLSI